MSKTTEATKKRTASSSTATPPATKRAEVGPAMFGRDILVQALEREGVEVIFAYPGGASMEFHQALTKSKIRTILPRHEQGGAFAAEGYARALGKAGFQETDFFGMTLPVVKHSYLVTDVNDIPRVIKEAFLIAQTGRPGPVVVDVPKNIQQSRTQPVFPAEVNLRGYDPDKKASDIELNEIIGLIEKSERPVLYVGGGIITSNASQELREFVEATQIPVTTTIMGCGCFPETHPLSLKWLGMHGTPYANWAVNGHPQDGVPGA